LDSDHWERVRIWSAISPMNVSSKVLAEELYKWRSNWVHFKLFLIFM
jgi:hypothetical protein